MVCDGYSYYLINFIKKAVNMKNLDWYFFYFLHSGSRCDLIDFAQNSADDNCNRQPKEAPRLSGAFPG